MFVHGAGHKVLHDFNHDVRHIQLECGQCAPCCFGSGQCQQLVNGVGGAHAAACNLAQGLVNLVWVCFALRQVGLYAQAGQRCFELVCRIG